MAKRVCKTGCKQWTVQEQYQPKEDFSWQRFSFSMGVDACINAYIGKMYLNISASPYYAHAKINF